MPVCLLFENVHSGTERLVEAEDRILERLFVAVGLAASAAGAGTALSAAMPATSEALIIQASDHAELNEKWCAANPNVEHILVLPAELFVDSQELLCNNGYYKLYRIVESDDPDDFEYYLDPPYGTENRLGCDGKAGRTMKIIAVNCRPLK